MGMGRPRTTWVKAVESDMRVKGLMREDALLPEAISIVAGLLSKRKTLFDSFFFGAALSPIFCLSMPLLNVLHELMKCP